MNLEQNRKWWRCVLVASITGFVIYCLFVFRPLPGRSDIVSELILCGMSLGMTIILSWAMENYYDWLSLTINVLFPLELYWLVTDIGTVPVALTKSLIIVVAVISIILGALVIGDASNRLKYWNAYIAAKAVWRIMINTFYTAVLFSSILLIYSAVDSPALLRPDPATIEDAEERLNDGITDKMEDLILLSPDRWIAISEDEKLRVGQIVLDIEAEYLGIPKRPRLMIEESNENEEVMVKAFFLFQDCTIHINKNHFNGSDPADVLDSLCHESFHAYQHYCCMAFDTVGQRYKKLLLFDSSRIYKSEFADYKSGDKYGVEQYKDQLCEINARRYAHVAAANYLEIISDYMTD